MEKVAVNIGWSLIDNRIRNQIEEEMEELQHCPDDDLGTDFKLFHYNYTTVTAIDKDYIRMAVNNFCLMGNIRELQDVVVEFINYNYGYGGGLEDALEFFITHYVILSILHLIDDYLMSVTYEIGPKYNYIIDSAHVWDMGITFIVIKET